MAKVKYPLTNNAIQLAHDLVKAWDNNQIDQTFWLIDATAGSDKVLNYIRGLGFLDESVDWDFRFGTLKELGEYGLISMVERPTVNRSTRLEITLLQELRNAVENDFEVSDYFLTLNAVGTIVYGNLEVKEGAIFQSGATNQGHIIQNTGAIATELRELLGSELLEQNQELRLAIDHIEEQKIVSAEGLGKVVAELGRCIEHLGNFGGAVLAIQLIARIFGGL